MMMTPWGSGEDWRPTLQGPVSRQMATATQHLLRWFCELPPQTQKLFCESHRETGAALEWQYRQGEQVLTEKQKNDILQRDAKIGALSDENTRLKKQLADREHRERKLVVQSNEGVRDALDVLIKLVREFRNDVRGSNHVCG